VGIIGQRKKKEEKREVRYFKKPNACSFWGWKFLSITWICRLSVRDWRKFLGFNSLLWLYALQSVLVKRQFWVLTETVFCWPKNSSSQNIIICKASAMLNYSLFFLMFSFWIQMTSTPIHMLSSICCLCWQKQVCNSSGLLGYWRLLAKLQLGLPW
jgi:hypothetical protein